MLNTMLMIPIEIPFSHNWGMCNQFESVLNITTSFNDLQIIYGSDGIRSFPTMFLPRRVRLVKA